MASTLGVIVSSDEYMNHVLGLAKAAHEEGREVIIFFTHLGVRLMTHPRFSELIGIADIRFCRVNVESQGLIEAFENLGLEKTSLTNQLSHAEMIHESDRYISL